ncbi:DUF4259 domain-containing protein [Streptomyces sp. me109]|uniref:DUF4259 domain-containing protein n=1 Tax=unclassified Streptomyces TaxID=2593676 RepID=UPI0011CD9FC6|nr:DUF4259 domain-containing protein [Streptomyces sp. me109]
MTLRKEIGMGTWDIGPFGNGTATDFADAPDDAEPRAREALIRGVLVRTVVATGGLGEAARRCPPPSIALFEVQP